MKHTLIIAMASFCLCAKGQTPLPKTYVYLNNDSLVSATHIKLRADGFNRLYVHTGESRIPATQVKFFQSNNGFYANIRQLNYFNESEFVERVSEGKLNLYDRLIYDPYLDRRRRGPIAYAGRYPVSETAYFNKGFGNLKPLNYENLKFELQDNERSMDLLAAYRRKRNASIMYFGAAGAFVIASMVSFFSDKHTSTTQPINPYGFPESSIADKNYTPSLLLLGGALAFSVTGGLKLLKSKQSLIDAVDVYNR